MSSQPSNTTVTSGVVYRVYHSNIWNNEFLKACLKIRRWNAPSADPAITAVMLYTEKDARQYCRQVEKFGGTFYQARRKGMNGGTSYVKVDEQGERAVKVPQGG